ncbi:MAG: class I SAM-dependent methyltransferase [Spirochaetales bacterium]|nr:class I SAM-dependent methyltransferase [Spirochaetales bacterium]
MKTNAVTEGRQFDWSNASEDYAKYRDVYPQEFYQRIADRGLCISGQNVLDVGTGTGVLPRNMYHFGAKWTGVDRAVNQINYAKQLAQTANQDIKFIVSPAEELPFPSNTFDVITVCQCYWYLDYDKVLTRFADILKPDGKILFLTMMWLPYEDKIAGASEDLVLRYPPDWVSAGATREPIHIPQQALEHFRLTYHEEYPLYVHFTRESWHGRMRASGGVGATLTGERLTQWDTEHRALLDRIAPTEFDVLHYAAMAEITLTDKP